LFGTTLIFIEQYLIITSSFYTELQVSVTGRISGDLNKSL